MNKNEYPLKTQVSTHIKNLFTYHDKLILQQSVYDTSQSEIIRGLSIIMLGPRGTFGGISVFMVGLYSTT